MSFDYVLSRVKGFEKDITSVVLKGSRIDEASLDYWSDTDVVYILKDEVSITEEYVKEILKGFGEPVAFEKYMGERYCLIRGIFTTDTKIDEWDILLINHRNVNEDFTFPTQSQVIFGEQIALHYEKGDTLQTRNYDKNWVESVWYKLFASVKRICRYDNLIGLHLILDVYRDLLVVKMIDRDVEMNTNIHRFGGNENLDDLVPLRELELGDRSESVGYIYKLGKCFDNMMINRFPEYNPRITAFGMYCNQSVAAVNSH